MAIVNNSVIEGIKSDASEFEKLSKDTRSSVVNALLRAWLKAPEVSISEVANEFREISGIQESLGFLRKLARFYANNLESVDMGWILQNSGIDESSIELLWKLLSDESPFLSSIICDLKTEKANNKLDTIIIDNFLMPLSPKVYGTFFRVDLKFNGIGFDAAKKSVESSIVMTKSDMIKLKKLIESSIESFDEFNSEFKKSNIQLYENDE